MQTRIKHYRVINGVTFQAGWLFCALTPVWGVSWLAPLFAAAWLAAHLRWLSVMPRVELLTVLALIPVGFAFDSLLAASGWVQYAGQWGPGLAPIWIVCMWALFATTLHNALDFIYALPPLPRWALAVFGGGFGGVTSYLAGTRLGAIVFPNDFWITVVVLSLLWALTVPLCVWIAAAIRSRFGEA